MKQITGLFVALSMIGFIGCKGATEAEEKKRSETGAVQSNEVSTTVTTKKDDTPTGPVTKIEFEETVYDFGEVFEGEKVRHEFVFTNVGDEPLVIENAKGGCGCTVPEWPREPIPPGGKGKIVVEYNTKNHGSPEGRKQTKRVTVTANTDPKNTFLTVTGIVKKKSS